ncbi:integrin beta-nu [Phlebotomus argentipes]|uniref:integrin beta-nu n=1 Tax=Phlebotomus argentipes TaxID=94469 RepID=UPI0028932D8B|nr:integrin beta-nu [Phlebotomus argentipes]
MKYFTRLCLFLTLCASCLAGSSICITHSDCGGCLHADMSCSWCTDRNYDMRKVRCMTKADLIASGCRADFILSNVKHKVEYVRNENPVDFTKSNPDAIQIQPQHIKLKLQRQRTQTVKMTYKPAKNYPLDLYYLMDLTVSMRDDKDTLVNMGGSLVNALYELTENYRLGFGSFADKPRMPFIFPDEKYIENPCAPEREVCEPVYGFRHRLSFTEDIEKFIQKVNSSDVTGNVDNLEGGLDALMQILVCGDKIGWKEKARKIIVFASDGQMHFSGDGLLAGIVMKNDKLCHLSDDGEYLASTEIDYPSLEEIYRTLTKHKISVIFAVTRDVHSHYDQIHNLLHGMSSVGTLMMDSSNILELVRDGYQEFIKQVEFFDNAPPHIRIDYETNCGVYKYRKSQSFCNNIEINKKYEFYINITLLDLPEDGRTKDTIRIEESHITDESLTMDIEIESDCKCLTEEKGEYNSPLCNYKGEMRCGMCICDSGWAGQQCDCELSNFNSYKALENNCRIRTIDSSTNETTYGSICSDNGQCICGECFCNAGVDGKYCQCQACPLNKGKECSDHGTCDCGVCKCLPDWEGDQCQCPAKSVCIAPNSNVECSGKGKCECGRCVCNSGSIGKFCEGESTEGSSLCSFYENCVLCLIHRLEGQECDKVMELCSSQDGQEYYYEFIQRPPDNEIKCVVHTKEPSNPEITCRHEFIYENTIKGDTFLKILHRNCKPVNTAFISLMLVIATIVIGLVLILAVKLHHHMQDKREWAKFEEEKKNTQYHELNQIYKTPITQFEVPEQYRQSLPEPTFEVLESPTRTNL